jgi:hypothetical protein
MIIRVCILVHNRRFNRSGSSEFIERSGYRENHSLTWFFRTNNSASDRRLSAKLVSTFADRGCLVFSAADPYGRYLGFLDPSHYHFFQVAPQLYSRT